MYLFIFEYIYMICIYLCDLIYVCMNSYAFVRIFYQFACVCVHVHVFACICMYICDFVFIYVQRAYDMNLVRKYSGRVL